MSTKLSQAAIRYIVARLIDNADDAISEASEKPTDDFYKGRKFAYYEVLDTIKSELMAHDQNLADFGLDINLEHKLS